MVTANQYYEEIYSQPYWFVLHAPIGFGRPNQVYFFEKQLRALKVEFCFPCMEVLVGTGKTVLKPLFTDYAFIRCVWTPELESKIIGALNRPLEILKEELSMSENTKANAKRYRYNYPVRISAEEVKQVLETTAALEKDIDKQYELLDAFVIGDDVRYVKGALKGFIGKVVDTVSLTRVVVEMVILGRQVQLPTDSSSLERL